jgi:hypothetical protein
MSSPTASIVTFAAPAPVAAAVPTLDPAVLYPTAPLFDFETGDFVRDGAGRIVQADGYTAWAQRTLKAILTRRGASPLYAPTFGTLLDVDQRISTRAAREQAIEADVRQVCLRDPATRSVDGFTWSYAVNTASVACTITPTIGAPRSLVIPDLTVAGRG